MSLRLVPRNFHDEATLSSELPPLTGFPLANTQNTERGKVWRSNTGTNQYFRGTYADGLARTASHFSFFWHRCHGGSVQLQLYSDAAWTTQVYNSGTVPIINVVPTEGLDWGITPYAGGGSIDPFLTDAPYWIWFTPTAHKSYKVSLSSHSALYGFAKWQICRVFLGHRYSLPYNVVYDNALTVVDMTDRNRSRGGSLRTNIGPSWREFNADIKRIPNADQAAWVDIRKYVGTGRDFILSLFPEEGTRRERDHFMNCQFKSLDALVKWHLSYLSSRIQIEEV